MISKTVINAGLTKFYPVVVLSDEINEIYIDGSDYSDYRLNEGFSDKEIMTLPDLLRPGM